MIQQDAHVRSDLETLARECAELEAADCDQVIADHAALAIRERRIDDAVFWQRVKFRSRMLRAMARSVPEDERSGADHVRNQRA